MVERKVEKLGDGTAAGLVGEMAEMRVEKTVVYLGQKMADHLVSLKVSKKVV